MRVGSRLVGLVCLIALVAGCATYTPQVAVPSNDTDVDARKLYYRDQFKAFGKEVAVPDPDAPEAQRKGYEEAKVMWRTASILRGTLVLGLGIFSFVMGMRSMRSTLNELDQFN